MRNQPPNLVVSILLFPHSAWLNGALKYGALTDECITRTNRSFSTIQYITPVDLILVKEGRYHSIIFHTLIFLCSITLMPLTNQITKKTNKQTGATTFLEKKREKERKKKEQNRNSYVLTVLTAGTV